VRFLGTNFRTGANFPTKEDARRLRACATGSVCACTWTRPGVTLISLAVIMLRAEISAKALDFRFTWVLELKKNGI